jgi:hypothetical protein
VTLTMHEMKISYWVVKVVDIASFGNLYAK